MIGQLRKLYPLIYSILPALNIAAYNAGWFKVDDLLVVLVATLGLFAVLYVLITLALWRHFEAELPSFVTLIIIGYFYSYRPVYSKFSQLVEAHLLVHGFLLCVVIATIATAIVWLLGQRVFLHRLTTFLALTGTIVLAWMGSLIITHELRGRRAVRSSQLAADLVKPIRPEPSEVGDLQKPKRDIYLIILDEHANSASLRQRFGFDNRAFDESLRSIGFTIPRVVRSNYSHTSLSLPSLLNFVHLTPLSVEVGSASSDPTVADHLIQINRATRFLQEHGYEIIFAPSQWWPATRHLRAAQRELDVWHGVRLSRELTRSELRRRLVRMTPLALTNLGGAQEYADYVRRTFASLSIVAGDQGPKFVVAHILSPHKPYVFDRKCRTLPNIPEHEWEPQRSAEIQSYLEQVQCVDRMVLDLVRAVIQKSAVAPIILLQGDHGTTPMGEHRLEFGQDRFEAFGAYYLPAGGDRMFTDSVTLVNVFAKVFNHYFGTSIPLQPDALYLSSSKTPYALRILEPQAIIRP
jgi:hypothetical protein